MPSLRAALVTLALAAGLVGCQSTSELDDNGVSDGSGSGPVVDDEQVDEPEPATGSPRDASTAARVLLALAADPRVDAMDFDATAEDGVVTLMSTTRSHTAWTAASEIARGVDGVTEVHMTTPAPTPSDTPDEVGAAPDLEALRALGTRRDVEPALPEPDDDEGAAARAASGDRPRTVRVEAGDSLSIIASRAMGDGNQWHRIYELNRSTIGPNPERLVEGMVLRIPQD